MAAVDGLLGEYTLPACTFTAPENKEFDAWQIGETRKNAGDKIDVSENTEVKALWKDVENQGGNESDKDDENGSEIVDGQTEENKGLSGGAIAGIVIGAIVGAAGIAVGVMFLLKKKAPVTPVGTSTPSAETAKETTSAEAEASEEEKEENSAE